MEREPGATTEIRLALVHPCRIRLDRLLASELGLPRAAVRELAVGLGRRELRRPVVDGLEAFLSGVGAHPVLRRAALVATPTFRLRSWPHAHRGRG